MEDLVQDVLLAAWTRLTEDPALRIRNLGAYLIGIAQKKIADLGRRRRPAQSTDPAIFDRRPASPHATAELRLLGEERRRQIVRALRRLGRRERQLLYRRFVLGEPHGLACRRAGIDPACGSRIVYQALGKLREASRQVAGAARRSRSDGVRRADT